MSDSALPPLAVTLTALRVAQGWPQVRLARALGLHGNDLSRFENGRRPLSREQLEQFIAPMGLGPEAIDYTLFWLEVRGLQVAGPSDSPFELDQVERRRILQVATTAGWTVLNTTADLLARGRWAEQARQARERAAVLWRRLRSYSPAERRLLIEGAEEYRSWALCELVCERSEAAAADDPARARELAELALFVAERALGGELWRTRLQGLGWAFLGNALRVASDLRGAERAFARAWVLWEAGAAADPGVLDASRLLDLEASLRRAQRRFPEAIALLDRALTASPAAAGRILLKQAFTYEQMGDCERALVALEQAAPRIDAEREPRLIWVHRLNLGVNLCHLGRYAEAAPLAAEARERAIALRNDLDLLRVLWLEARVSAGLGRRAEALAALGQVRDDFAARGLAYDAALATLELAVLWLEEGRHAEVRELGGGMVPLFASLEVYREALAALRVFWRAAEQETATVDLARRLLGFLERARYDPDLHFEAGSTR